MHTTSTSTIRDRIQDFCSQGRTSIPRGVPLPEGKLPAVQARCIRRPLSGREQERGSVTGDINWKEPVSVDALRPIKKTLVFETELLGTRLRAR